MRKIFKSVVGLTTILATASLMMATPVMAAPSIGQLVPDGVTLIKGDTSLPDNTVLSLQNANVNNYSLNSVQEGIENFNDDNTIVSVEELLQDINFDLNDNVATNNGKPLEVSQLDALMPMVDLVATDGQNSYYNIDGTVTASFKTELAKDMNKDELVIMAVNPDDGSVSFIEPTNYNPENGEITADFNNLGSITLLKYSPDNADDTNNADNGKSDSANLAQMNNTNANSLDSPATGDNSNIALQVLLLSSAVTGIAGTTYMKKRK